MVSLLVTVCALSLGQAPKGALEILEPKTTYGHLGAPRPKEGALPGDRIYYSFGIKNLSYDDKGDAQFSIAIEIKDESGKVFYEQKPFNQVAHNYFGGDVLPSSSYIEVPLDAPPGKLNWKLTLEDRVAKKTVSTTGVGMVLPAKLGIVRVGLFGDATGSVPEPALGVVGEQVYVNFSLVGFGRDAKTKAPNVALELKILDESGKPLATKPLSGKVNDAVPESQRVIAMQFPLMLDPAGRYTLVLSARCEVSNTSAEVSLPLRVMAAE